MKRVAGLIALVVLVGCGGSPTAPSNQLSGTWTGTAVAATGASADVTATLSQDGSSVSGTWVENYQGQSYGGTVSGSFDGRMFTFTFSDTVDVGGISCVETANGNVEFTAGNLDGGYSGVATCGNGGTASISGTVKLQKS